METRNKSDSIKMYQNEKKIRGLSRRILLLELFANINHFGFLKRKISECLNMQFSELN